MQDLRFAVRTLLKQPVFTLVAVLTLALGIGANTAIFSLLYQTLLRPLPYPHADRLVFVWNSYPLMGLPQASVSIPDFLDRRTQAPAVAEATLFRQADFNLSVGSRPERLRGLVATPSFFATLGREPSLGRGFTEAEGTPGQDRVVVLTHEVWTSRFGRDPGIVGRDIRLNGERYRVVGVLPADFEVPARDIGLIVPFAFTPEQMSDQERGREYSAMIARLRPGATIEELDGQMKTIVDRNLERLPSSRAFVQTSGFTGYAVGIREQLVGEVRAPILVLQAGVLVVLLIACANVANLLLMRASGRYRELAIRTTLGAGHWRLVRQLLTEGLVLAAAGGASGLVLGILGVRGLVALTADRIPAIASASVHPAVLAFTTGIAVATGLVFGLVPAIAVARANTSEMLKDDATRGSAGRGTGFTRAALVVGETSLALVLLVGAGLLVKSFGRLEQVDPGFSPDNVLTAQLALPDSRYPDAGARRAFWGRLIDAVAAIPGVTAVGLTSNVPFNGRVSSASYSIVGYTPGPNEARPHARQEVVGGDYFAVLRVPLIAGRVFSEGDTSDSPPVVVIDRYLAKRYFAGRDPLGQQITRGGSTVFTIVGVVGTLNTIDLSEPVAKERIYYPIAQTPLASMGVVLRTAVDPLTLVPQLRAAVMSLDPEQPIYDVRTMNQWVARSLEGRRSPMLLLVLFAAVALALSSIGIYGVLAFAVSQRGREFGIRQALGANRRAILALVLWHGLRTAGVGIALGLGASLAVTRYMQTLLFGVRPHDLTVFAGVTAVLVGVALLACLVPAIRATRIAPMQALRES
jgi:putative ABC transport system permease protein